MTSAVRRIDGGSRVDGGPRRAGRHRLIAKLDQGGMAEVYLAVVEDRIDSGALRVVKIMPRSMASDPALVDMFLDEARLAMRLGHPHVVQTMEAGRTSDDSLFIAMEWLEGASLFRLAQRARELAEELPAPAAVAVMLQVLDGLHYLHELRDLDGTPLDVIHRDLTPSNVFLASTGHVKILDFGIAKTSIQHAITVVGTRKGKLSYLAPEAITGGTFDRRADVYAAGVVLWELLAGRRLWRGSAALEKRGIPPRLEEYGVPTPLADVAARALARAPEDRYLTALAMADELQRASASCGGVMRGADLALLVEQLLGEDVRNVRRLAANAIRSGRADTAGERMTTAPEGTSVTVRPGASVRSGWRLAAGVALASAASAVLAVAGTRRLHDSAEVTDSVAPATSWRDVAAEPARRGVPLSRDALARIAIEPVPVTAHVWLDGRRLGDPPHVVELPADGSQHVVRVSAPGHVDREIVVAATGDVTVSAELSASATDLSSGGPPWPHPRRSARRGTSGAAPAQETPAQEAPAQEASAQEASAQEASAQEASAQETSTTASTPSALYGPRPPVRALDPSDPW